MKPPHAAAFATDSLRRRQTPSAGLTVVAAYVAAEFQRLGLRPEGQTYPSPTVTGLRP